MAENPEDLIVTDAELRRQLPALAQELKIGGADAVAAADRAEAVARDLDGLKAAVDSAVAQSPADSAVAAVMVQPGTQTRKAIEGALIDAQTRIRPRVVEPQPVLLGIGDSLTFTAGPTGGPWMSSAAAILEGWSWENHGWSGQTAPQIAARMNASPTLLVFPDHTIPASGSVTVGASVNPVTGSFSGSRTGSVVGVRGTLASTGSTLTFTRAAAGAPITLTGPATFTADEGTTAAPGLSVIWVGRNGSDDDATMAALNALVASRPSLLDRFVVIPPPEGEGWESKKDLRHRIIGAYPVHVLDVPSLLQTDEAAQIAGVTFTADDRADIAAGYPPRVFRTDAVHYGPLGRLVIGTLVARHLIKRGWSKPAQITPADAVRSYRSGHLPTGKTSAWAATVGPTLTASSGAEPTVVSDSGVPVVELSASGHLMSTPDTTATDQTLAVLVNAKTGQTSVFVAGMAGLSLGIDVAGRWNAVGSGQANSSTTVDGKWHTAVLVRTGTQVDLYLDGQNILSGYPGTSTVAVTRIGGGGGSAHGRIADLTQWKRALTASEVGKYHAAVKERYPALALA